MKIETKYNVGDKFWQMRLNKPEQFTVVTIEIHHEVVPGDNYSSHPKTTIRYGCSPNSYHYEGEVFDTKEALIAAL